MKIIDCEQNSPEWFQARCGIPTASNFGLILTTKGEPSKQAIKYAYRLAGERITGKQEDTYQNGAMLRGQEMEDEARKLYQVLTEEEVQKVGFCVTTGKVKYGASPDSLVGEKGGLEIKCPIMSTHVSYLLDGTLPTDYIQQVQGNLLVTGREWWDFMSYYPAMKPFVIRVKRDEAFLKLLDEELKSFCKIVDETTEKIK